MVRTVAMYDKALERIGSRHELDGLKPAIEFATFGKDGRFRIGGEVRAAADTSVDYLWLSTDISRDDFQDGAFQMVLDTGRVGVLQTYNAGLDGPFYRAVAANGTTICNSSAQGVAIAEYVMAQVLSVVHPIAQQRELQARREWRVTPFREISTTRWLIVGFGPIGRAVAQRVKAFGAGTMVVRRSPATSDIVDEAGTGVDLARLAAKADIVVVAAPLNATTQGLIGERFFAALKPGAILVNVARGGLVDDAALFKALDDGRVATAVLDVFREEPLPATSPFWAHPKIRLTSHTSFAGSGSAGRWDQLFFDNVARFARGEPLANVVDPASLLQAALP